MTKELQVSAEIIRLFEKTEAQLEAFYEDIGIFAKKKPDDAVNKFKLGLVNQMLEAANKLLGNDYRPFPDFDTFSLDAIPSNSDVVTMLSQYLGAMDKYRKDHTNLHALFYYWNFPDDNSQNNKQGTIRAKRPKNYT